MFLITTGKLTSNCKMLFLTLLLVSVTQVRSQFTQDQLSEMLNTLNQQRASEGKSPLCLNSKLMQTAQAHSDEQAQLDKMDHNLGAYGGTDFGDRTKTCGFQGGAFAENVAMASFFDMKNTNDGWWNSPGHKANILGDYSHVGIAMAKNPNGNYYYTQFFGKSDSESCSSSASPRQFAQRPTYQSPSASPSRPVQRNSRKGGSSSSSSSCALAQRIRNLRLDTIFNQILPRYAPGLIRRARRVPPKLIRNRALPFIATCVKHYNSPAWNKYFTDILDGTSRTARMPQNLLRFMTSCHKSLMYRKY